MVFNECCRSIRSLASLEKMREKNKTANVRDFFFYDLTNT